MIYEKGTKNIKERRIYISTLLTKSAIPIDEKINTPIDEKRKVIYKYNNINNIKKNNVRNVKAPFIY